MSPESVLEDLTALRTQAEAMSQTLQSEPRQWGPFYAAYVDAMSALGWHSRALEELEVAAVALDQLERGSPVHITALYRMAIIQHELGDVSALVDTLKRLLRADPTALPLVRPLLSDALQVRLERDLDADGASVMTCARMLSAMFRGDSDFDAECDPVSVAEAVSSYAFLRIEELTPVQIEHLKCNGVHADFLAVITAGRDALTAFVSPQVPAKPWRNDPRVSPRIRDVLDTLDEGAKATISPWTAEIKMSRKMLGSEVFLFRHESDPFIISQWSETDRVTADTFWILPSKSIVLYYGSSNIRDIDARTRLTTLYLELMAGRERHDLDLAEDASEIIVGQYPIPHIGHYVWNGISGWDSFFKYFPRDKKPDAIAYCGNLKMMADVAEIYPQACNDIGRIIVSENEIQHAAIPRTRNAMLLTLKDDFVTESLARRMLGWAENSVSPEFKSGILEFRSRCFPMLLVNIRLDNRAWVEQEEGFVEVFKALRRNHPTIGFVIDGINTGVTQGWTHADMSVDRERELSRRLIEGSDGVMIYDSIGCTVAESLVVGDLADGFIGHVGAGMAKYRWISNLPGVAFSNEIFSTPGHRDGRLYDGYREGARQAIHVPQAAIQDDRSPGAPVGLKANFSMDWRSVHQAAEEFLLTLYRG